MANTVSSKIDKKSISLFWCYYVIISFFCIYLFGYQLKVLAFFGLLLILNLILFFVKVPKGYVEEYIIMNYLGLFGIVNSIVFSVFFALCMGANFLNFVLILCACLVVIAAIVFVESKIYTVEYFEKNKNRRQGVNIAIIMGAVLLIRLIPLENKVLLLAILLILTILFFALIYFFRLKAKWVVWVKTNPTDNSSVVDA